MNDNNEQPLLPDSALKHARATLREVLQVAKISRSQLYKLRGKGQFPAPVRSGRSVRWVLAEVLDHLRQQEDAR